MDSNESDEYTNDIPADLIEAANDVSLNLLPKTSRRQYTAAYNEFKKWRKTKKTNSFSEEIFLVYFDKLSKSLAPPTLWSRFSMLKATVNAYDNINISNYQKLIAFLKQQNKSYTPKKSSVLTSEHVSEFCNHAPDNEYLAIKVSKKLIILLLLIIIIIIIIIIIVTIRKLLQMALILPNKWEFC